MHGAVVVALRVLLAMSLLGSVLVQLVIVPLLWSDVDGTPLAGRISLVGIVVLGIVVLQVCGVCIWRLLTLVRRGRVFSRAAFRFVDVTIGAIAGGAALLFTLAALLAPGEIAPGVVALIGGAGVVVAGVALLVVVMRVLLAQAIERDVEATRLRGELDEVV